MALIIPITCGVFLALMLAIFFYFRVKQSQNLEMQTLRREIDSLQNKLSSTREDAVTQLLGWQLFEDRVVHNILESERYQFTMGLMVVDIDDFKLIVNALSHDAGDVLLHEVARRLEQCVRQVDSISRFAKDTFVILLTQLAKPETAAIISQRILSSLAEPFLINEREVSITACIGVALYPADGRDIQSLLRNANYALRLAKREGKHVSKFYQQKMHTQSQRDLIIYNGLSQEAFYQEFQVYFSPIMNVQDGNIFCMDSALRWVHPQLGTIETGELYTYAERQRKLNSISEWLLKNACKQFLSWRKSGFEPLLLGVTLSIKQLENSQFVYQISHILQELAFNPEHLLIEVKESWLQESMDVLEKAFNMLTYLKINLAIDDFGSGSFPLRYFKRGMIRYLKLSAALIDDVVENEQTRLLVKSLLSFGHSLSMQVIVQGVETEQQRIVLEQLGCGLMQGNAEALTKIAIPSN